MATLDLDSKLLYKSDKFLVIDKDFDVKVNSYDPNDVITVDKQLSYSFPDAIDETVEFGFRFQHRLDYATSGVLCVPLNRQSSAEIAKAFKTRTVLKHYLALVHGHVTTNYTYIDAPLCQVDRAKDEPFKMKVAPKGCENNAKDSQTFVITMEKGFYAGKPATKVLLIPFTGRSHQLRVHCKHMDHMIIGDYTYSNRTDLEPFRMMLHAYRLRFKLKDDILDVKASDPFTSSNDSLWKPDIFCISYEECINKFYCKENDYQFKIQDDVQYQILYQ